VQLESPNVAKAAANITRTSLGTGRVETFSGTIMAALEHGLPLVNLPIFADQPENAALCAKLGVGVTVSMEERTPEAIRAAVQKVLSDPDYHSKAKQIQSEMQALPGFEAVTRLLERLVSEKGPRGK
jgi:UDP:flavonoid glycosyltransferase YjiC (YdhE family)